MRLQNLRLLFLGGAAPKANNLIYRKFQARAYQVAGAAGQTVTEIEGEIGYRASVERILRGGQDVELRPNTPLQAGDEILVAGPTAAMVAAGNIIGPEIHGESVMEAVTGEVIDVVGRTLADIVDRVGDAARGVFLRELT